MAAVAHLDGEVLHMRDGLPDVVLRRNTTGGATMTQQELDALKALAAKANLGHLEARPCWPDAAACNVVPALVAEVERLTARVKELEAANADMYRTMEDACKRAEQAERELAAVRYSYAAAMDGEHP